MTTIFWIRVGLLLSTALFAAEDLIGSANMARLEGAWLAQTDRAISAVKDTYRLVLSVWPILLGIFASLTIFLGFFGSLSFFSYHFANKRTGPPIELPWYTQIAVIVVAFLVLYTLARFFLVPARNAIVRLTEVAKSIQHSKRAIELRAVGLVSLDPFAGFGAVASIVRLLFGLTLVLVALVGSLAVRGAILALMLALTVLLLPSHVLRAIARRTGAASMLKVGKYIVMLFSLLLSVILAA